MRIKQLLFFLIISLSINAQESGVPIIKNYSPDVFNAEPQIWAITQDKRGIMYFGASDGVLEYDGKTWRKIQTPKKQVVRSLDIDENGRIYVGSYNEFGYLEPNNNGTLSYVSLSASLDTSYNNFEDIWKTIVGADGIYFGSNEFVFKYDPKKGTPNNSQIKVYQANTSFFLLFRNNKDMYTYQRKKGLCKIGKDSLTVLDGGSKLSTWFMLPFENNKALIGSNPDGLFVFDPSAKKMDETISKKYFDKKALSELELFLNENQLYHAVRLNDGRYALATIRSGIVIIDKSGKILQHICKENGLQSETVHFLFQDRQGGLWAALTYGISRIETHSPISTWDEKSGLVGSIYNVIRYKGQVYSSSNLGLHYLNNNNFFPVEELAGKNAIQVFDLKTLKMGGQNKFLATATNGIWEVNGKNASNISRFVSFGLYQSPIDPNCIFIPDGNDLFTLEYLNGKWIESNSLITFPNSPNSLVQTGNNELWCIVDNKPVFLQIKHTGSQKKATPVFFDEKKNIEIRDIKFNSITLLDHVMYFMTDKGIYTYDKKNNMFSKDVSLFKDLFVGKQYDFIDLFKLRQNYTVVVKRNSKLNLITICKKGETWIADSSTFKRLRDIELYYNDGDSLLWFVSSKTLYKYNLKSNFKLSKYPYSLIRSVTLQTDSVVFNGSYITDYKDYIAVGYQQLSNNIPVFPFRMNDIVFYFSVPEFDDENYNEYSYFLEGESKQKSWSIWSKEDKKEFTNLSEGDYVFKVKARNIFGKETGISYYSFTIQAPWYRTIWAYLLYVIFSLLLLWILIKLNVRRLEQAKKHLEQIVAERTAEIMEQNEEISQQKEEILVQAEQLEMTNIELEKLSLVATETDNAVIICNSIGNIEWVNPGFTRLYGYTVEELIRHYGSNIADNSSHPNIKELLNQLKETGESCIYESVFESKSGDRIWAQTTLTPIFDDENCLIKIIAIDSNITQLKLAEEEINQQKEEILSQRDEILKQKKELTDSILYALQIQKSMLPTESFFKNLVADHFVFYKPRDIVSGDFYWINEIEEKIIISMGDCTGHGVPGAFMSLLGITFLKEIIIKEYITHPAVILNRLRKEVIRSLKQQGEGAESKDGMDITLCVFDKNTKVLEFSGANNSALIVRNKELMVLKGERMPIGIYENMHKFSLQSHDLQSGDLLYLYSDGFQDQFGGKNGKKFLSKKFKNLILSISDLPFKNQELELAKTLKEWKNNFDQVDDITVLGIRFF